MFWLTWKQNSRLRNGNAYYSQGRTKHLWKSTKSLEKSYLVGWLKQIIIFLQHLDDKTTVLPSCIYGKITCLQTTNLGDLNIKLIITASYVLLRLLLWDLDIKLIITASYVLFRLLLLFRATPTTALRADTIYRLETQTNKLKLTLANSSLSVFCH